MWRWSYANAKACAHVGMCLSTPALGSNKYPLPDLGFNKLIQSDGNGSISFWISATPTGLFGILFVCVLHVQAFKAEE
jgi:hypothetical protein